MYLIHLVSEADNFSQFVINFVATLIMEKQEKSVIINHLHKLTELTSCNSLLLSYLIGKGVLGKADVSKLQSIPDEMEKNMKFYLIIITKPKSYNTLLNALEKTKQTGVLEVLKQPLDTQDCKQYNSASPENNKKCIRFDITSPVTNFCGRKSEILELHDKMTTGKRGTSNAFHIVAVLGLGGIGKTELCRSYAHQYSDYFDGNIIWIDTCREAAILKCFQRLAEHHLQLSITGCNGKEKEAKTIIDEVYQSFAEQKCLFIFDNADCVEYINTYLPTRVLNPIYVLITSRNKEWDLAGSSVVLNEMTNADAIEFVQNELGVDLNDAQQPEDFCLLTNILQQFPLALQQCTCFIKQQRRVVTFNISDYIDMFERNKKLLLNSRIPVSIFGNYSETTFTTWQITTDLIRNDKEFGSMAIKILNIISYFENEMIPMHVLRDLNTDDETAILSAVELLVRYSMVNSQPEKATLSIHRLVQNVTKEHLREENNEVPILRVALNLFDKSLSNETVYHAIATYFHAIRYKELVIEVSSLPWMIIFGFSRGYLYYHAQHFKNIALEKLNMYLPGNHIDILRTELHWGIVEFKHCNYEECLLIFEDLQKRYLAHEPAANLGADLACIKFYIASTSLKLGRLTDTLSLATESLKACVTVHGIDYGGSIHCLQLVAVSMEQLGLYSDSLKVYEHCMELYGASEGSEISRNILMTMQNMAQLYFKMGNLHKAKSMATEIFKKGPHNLYKTDVKFTQTGSILAHYFFVQRKYVIASMLAYDVYSFRKEVFGVGHIKTLLTLQLLANIKCRINRREDALLINEYILVKLTARLGKFHEETLTAKCNMLTVCSELQLHSEALRGFQEIVDILNKTNVANKHYHYTQVQLQHGNAHAKMGNYNEALNIFVEIEKILEDKFGGMHYVLKKLKEDIQLLKNTVRNSSISPQFTNNMK